jgi:pimeloyl-ACP methyl ester carboxylesterase
VLGGSMGGMLAQVFVRQHPKWVDKLILSTTTLPNVEYAQRYLTALEMMLPLPEEDAMNGAKAWMVETIDPSDDKALITRAFVDELYSQRLNKADLVSTQQCLVDFHTHYHFSADDLAGWHGHIYVLESDNDATFDEVVRAKVRELYPNAVHYVFHGAGHSPATTQRDLYFQVVKGFLKG